MKKYKFTLKKVQYASPNVDWNENETIGDVTERLEKMSEDELDFGSPEYSLEAISKDEGKICRIIWREKSS